MRDFNLGYAAGWFQVGWSSEFPTGVARPVRAFGDDLVIYRGESGQLHALNAHCPHMGAHLGHGGRVEGDALVCPFHGWAWDEKGTNISIPGDSPKRAVRTGCRSVVENCGLVLLWNHSGGAVPEYDVPALVPNEDIFHPILPGASKSWEVGFPPHVVAANAIDSAHFVEVHKAGSPPTIMNIVDEGPVLRVSQEIVYGAGKKQSWLTPEGPRKGELEITLFGLGLSHTKFVGSDDAVNLVAVTPVDDQTSIFRMTNWVPLDTDYARRVAEQFKQAERDFVIWENMRFIEKPPLMRSESQPYLAFKRWSERLYQDAQAGNLFAATGSE